MGILRLWGFRAYTEFRSCLLDVGFNADGDRLGVLLVVCGVLLHLDR